MLMFFKKNLLTKRLQETNQKNIVVSRHRSLMRFNYGLLMRDEYIQEKNPESQGSDAQDLSSEGNRR